jgi:hypothetical protein
VLDIQTSTRLAEGFGMVTEEELWHESIKSDRAAPVKGQLTSGMCSIRALHICNAGEARF